MDESIGARLRRLRLGLGLSQRELAAEGVSYAYISRIEAGTRTPSVKALRKLAPKLGVSVEYLETGVDVIVLPLLRGDVDASIARWLPPELRGEGTWDALSDGERASILREAGAEAVRQIGSLVVATFVLREQEKQRESEERISALTTKRGGA